MAEASSQAVSGGFTKTQGWLDWIKHPARPHFRPPAGAVDAHCHVFGPGALFPYARQRKYTPCDAGKEQLFALREHLGLTRNVIVQATCHGCDNRALVDACVASGGSARGVAAVERDIDDASLEGLHLAGVRGVRYTFLERLGESPPWDEVRDIAARIRSLGWHVVVYFEAAQLERLRPLLAALPVPVVVDHMGCPDVGQRLDDPGFAAFHCLLAEHQHIWTKVSCLERLSRRVPGTSARPYADALPFARSIVESFEDRVLWGTDWPHPNLRSHMPDDAWLVDLIPEIAITTELQHKLLVDNPMALYWPELVAPPIREY